ncbi:AraC family transcriptional regulator [Salinisphaera sp.]|uniref:AraC family transcriptional regulator n=1 Tax=Salinisphaera sp. TaxID=1914330 RepID=UPI000C4A9726|nr:AraC family transcriptional regulator [Salinisphaera sp.]MBS62045.1 AraC family transcriptional regulator [Salinisphaera sp.]
MSARTHDSDWFIHSPTPRLERIEAYFGSHAYDPHRHDTYAIGVTLTGVQSFHYRGAQRHSLPGRTIVIHPDEVHDGHAGDAHGFRYRMVYVPPTVFQDMLGGQPLPFLPGGITTDTRMAESVLRLLRPIDDPLETFEEDDALFDLIGAMNTLAGTGAKPGIVDAVAAQRARTFMDDSPQGRITLAQLEAASGQNRWRLSRDFRLLFGTSPYRYLTMRRLERCKRSLAQGLGLAEASLAAGFADQSHMTRQFRDAYGISPGRWLKLTAQASGQSRERG